MWTPSRTAVRWLPKQLPRRSLEPLQASCVHYKPMLNQTAVDAVVLRRSLSAASSSARAYHSSAAVWSRPIDPHESTDASDASSSSRKTRKPFPTAAVVAARGRVSSLLFVSAPAVSAADLSPLLLHAFVIKRGYTSSATPFAPVSMTLGPVRAFGTTRGRRFSWANKTPYELLNVSRTATDKEIKIAYFREAKKYHPDLNPSDPEAKEKFQAIAAAYELLSDAKRRATYDATGSTGQYQSYGGANGQPGGNGGGNQHYYGQQADYGGYSQQHAEDIFRSVQGDVDVIKEALGLLREEWRDEFNVMVDAMQRGDWPQVWEIAKEHRLLISAVVVPTILFLRYPPAVFAVMRMLMAGANVAVAFLVYTGNLQAAAQLIWRQIVTLSVEQKNRVEERRRQK